MRVMRHLAVGCCMAGVVGCARSEDGKLVGTRVGRYTTRGPDSVIRVRVEGTRLP